jgi:N-acetyltransferase
MTAPDWQPTLIGPTLLVRPLRADDFELLYAAAADPDIWVLHPEPTRYQRPVFEAGFFASALASGTAFVILDRATGVMIGSSRYYESKPEERSIYVGYTFLARTHWGGTTNAELKRLMLDHAFQYVDTVWFHVGNTNWRSRKALEKIGAVFSHEEEFVQNGTPSTRVHYRIDRP